MSAALAAAGRAERLTGTELRHAEQQWDHLCGALRPVELTAEVAADAGRLAGQHSLRGADAVHLASVLTFGLDNLVFTVWDTRLRTGAHRDGVRLAPAWAS